MCRKPAINSTARRFVLVAMAVVGSITINGCDQMASMSTDAVLATTSEQMNRQLPMMVDEMTRLDKTAALPGQKLQYKYTILKLTAVPSREALISAIRPETLKKYKNAPEMADFRRIKVTLEYAYYDEKGKELATFQIGPKDL